MYAGGPSGLPARRPPLFYHVVFTAQKGRLPPQPPAPKVLFACPGVYASISSFFSRISATTAQAGQSQNFAPAALISLP